MDRLVGGEPRRDGPLCPELHHLQQPAQGLQPSQERPVRRYVPHGGRFHSSLPHTRLRRFLLPAAVVQVVGKVESGLWLRFRDLVRFQLGYHSAAVLLHADRIQNHGGQ